MMEDKSATVISIIIIFFVLTYATVGLRIYVSYFQANPEYHLHAGL